MTLFSHHRGTERDPLTGAVNGAAIEVPRELSLRRVQFKKQVPQPVIYKDVHLDCGYRMDIVVENKVVVEVKSADAIHPIHEAQLLTYLKLSGLHIGLLLNFNTAVLKDGIKRFKL